MPKISVIIPVYNVERYIERCAQSLFEQTLEDMEYIFINDCTPDDSMTVLKRVLADYPHRQKQVNLVDLTQNQGLPGVRKQGIAIATGEYVIFCDSDDWVEKDMYQLMYEKAIQEDFDVVICDYYLTDGASHRYWGQHCQGDPISALLNNQLSASVCNKLVKRSILTSLGYIYPQENICEDFVHNVQYFINAKKIGYVDKALYYYFRHAYNMTNATLPKDIIPKFEQTKKNIDLGLKILYDQGLEKKYRYDIIHQKLFVRNNLLPIIGQYYSLWKSTYEEINSRIFSCPCMHLKEKILFVLIYIKVYPFYKKFKRVK